MQKIFKQYITTALDGPNCQLYSDLLDLPFKDKSIDFILASHVLEHIEEDYKALSEISRILKPGAIAILPVPIVAVETFEYKESHQDQFGHVRAPGLDYFELYKRYFSKVIIYKSSDFQNVYQTYINENRKKTFTNIQLLPSLDENKYMDYVPVCFA